MNIICRQTGDKCTPTKRSNAQLKKNPPGRESKIGECHATDYAFLCLWYKFKVRKFSRFVSFTFRVK